MCSIRTYQCKKTCQFITQCKGVICYPFKTAKIIVFTPWSVKVQMCLYKTSCRVDQFSSTCDTVNDYIAKTWFFGLQFCRRKCGCVFNHFDVIRPKATEFDEITQRLRLLRRLRSSKVTEFGTNRKLICNFLSVINSNLPFILHRFRDIAFGRSKIAIFGYPSCV